MIEMPDSLVAVNTMVPNKLVAQSILDGQLEPLSGYARLQREVKCGTNSRLDLALYSPNGEQCLIEIKGSSLVKEGVAYFPDAVTTRGLKHLVVLQEQVRQGNRAVIFFLIQRTDAKVFSPADHIDPEYGRELRNARRAGVEIMVYDVSLDLERVVINRQLPCRME
jgi:sugar fermentation stimulation protein A